MILPDPYRAWSLPQLAKANGIPQSGFVDFVKEVLKKVEEGALKMERLRDGGWDIPVIRRP